MPQDSPAPDESDWHARITAARRQGNQLAVYDLAAQALALYPDAMGFEYAALLALARSGATTAARARFDAGAARIAAIGDAHLASEFAALDGRLWKDLAGRQSGAASQGALLKSAAAYEAAHRSFGGYYPAINAATMNLAAGQVDRAAEYATIALVGAGAASQDYWSVVTQAEALLILGDEAAAAAMLLSLAPSQLSNLDEMASTRRQLAWVAKLTGAALELSDHLPTPRILSWMSGVTPGNVPAFPAGQRVIAFGPILSPTDIATAQTLLGAGAEVNLVLPCAPGVWSSGWGTPPLPNLPAVLAALLEHAASVLHVTDEGGPHEPAARLLCEEQANGLAILRAEGLAVRLERLVPPDLSRIMPDMVSMPILPRESRAVVFGDVRGFSRLTEAGQLDFLTHIIGGFAEVLERIPAVDYAETAGDGLYIVLSDVRSAAECCFALHDVLRPERVAAAGLPAHLGLRLSAHVGPVHRRYDPVIRREKFCGMEVIRTARIEPMTPVGEIFVTEQFAAVLAHAAHGAYVCEYAGRQQMAKGFGECRMHSLRHRGGPSKAEG